MLKRKLNILGNPNFHKKIKRSRLNRINRELSIADNADKARAFDRMISPRALTPQQREAIALMTDYTRDLRDFEICKELGIHVNTLGSWRKDPVFSDELDKEITKQKRWGRREAWRSVMRGLKRGKWSVVKEYLKGIGDLKEHANVSNDPNEEEDLESQELDAQIKELQNELGGIELEGKQRSRIAEAKKIIKVAERTKKAERA